MKQQQFEATWLPTGECWLLNSNSHSLAWQEAIETKREELIRELIPKTYNHPTEGSCFGFKDLLVPNYLIVKPVTVLKVSVYLTKNHVDYFVTERNLDQFFKDRDIQETLECLNNPFLFSDWLFPLMFEGKLSYFVVDLSQSESAKGVHTISVVR